ncbi:MAG: MBL fold metallo-hydrolase [Bacteriovoracaceae bacterium]|nr:MBL fold metallo-hydrolase [Bacteriovoracaceae bacterium]
MKNSLKRETFPTGPLGCNTTFLYDEESKEALIIDAGQNATQVYDLITAKNLKVKYLLHTHAHFDHIGESYKLKMLLGGIPELYLHEQDQMLYAGLSEQGKYFGFNLPPAGNIDKWHQDEETFSFSSPLLQNFLKTLFTPGHTQGSCCFYTEIFETPLLFSGDTLFYRSIGRTDLPGGDSNLILKSIKNRLFTLPEETLVITGHGPKTTLALEKKHNPFVGSR